jgi:hypothetical protein
MQARAAVTEVVRVVGRQHTRMRGLVCELVQTGGAERTATAEWLSHYLVLHAAAERVGLRRESLPVIPSVPTSPGVPGVPGAPVVRTVPAGLPPRGPLVDSVVSLALALTGTHGLDEAAICHRAAQLEAEVVRHARAQERTILPRLLSHWPLADLERAVAALEAADLVFDRGPSSPLAAVATPDAIWRTAVIAIESLVVRPAEGEDQAPAARDAMTTAATIATTPTTKVTAAVRAT